MDSGAYMSSLESKLRDYESEHLIRVKLNATHLTLKWKLNCHVDTSWG